MKLFPLIAATLALFVFSLPAHAVECSSAALDLMCEEGQVLQGIDASGQKVCVEGGAGGAFTVQIVSHSEVNSPDYNRMTVSCPPETIRVGCAGTRDASMGDNCREEHCGIVGTRPVGENACEFSVDGQPGATSAVYAICVGTGT